MYTPYVKTDTADYRTMFSRINPFGNNLVGLSNRGDLAGSDLVEAKHITTEELNDDDVVIA